MLVTLINALSVVIGTILGLLLKKKLPSSLGSIFDIDTPEKYQALLESDGDLSILERCCDISFS